MTLEDFFQLGPKGHAIILYGVWNLLQNRLEMNLLLRPKNTIFVGKVSEKKQLFWLSFEKYYVLIANQKFRGNH